MRRTLFCWRFAAARRRSWPVLGRAEAASRAIGGAVAPGSFMAVFSTSLPPMAFSVADSVIEIVSVTMTGTNAICRAQALAGRITLPKPTLVPFGLAQMIQLRVEPHLAARHQFSIQRKDGSFMRAVVGYGFTIGIPVKVE